jgi:hypothetical protein
MKIVIDIDIEAIVREEIRAYIKENLVINNIKNTVESAVPTPAKLGTPISNIRTKKPPAGVEWEFASKPGSRRSPTELALHQKELSLDRLLTPEEKGQTKAAVEIDENKEEKAKAEAINKARIDDLAKEGMAAAKKELDEEARLNAEGMVAAKKELEEEAKLDAEAAGKIPTTTDLFTPTEDPEDETPTTHFVNGEKVESEATIPKTENINPAVNSLFG